MRIELGRKSIVKEAEFKGDLLDLILMFNQSTVDKVDQLNPLKPILMYMVKLTGCNSLMEYEQCGA